jgi:uridine phosphorylase
MSPRDLLAVIRRHNSYGMNEFTRAGRKFVRVGTSSKVRETSAGDTIVSTS